MHLFVAYIQVPSQKQTLMEFYRNKNTHMIFVSRRTRPLLPRCLPPPTLFNLNNKLVRSSHLPPLILAINPVTMTTTTISTTNTIPPLRRSLPLISRRRLSPRRRWDAACLFRLLPIIFFSPSSFSFSVVPLAPSLSSNRSKRRWGQVDFV